MDPLPDYEPALRAVLDAIAPMPEGRRRSPQAALGARLAAPVVADRDQPPFNRAAMDGYALRAADAHPGARLRVTGATAAGSAPAPPIAPGQAVRIATGAPLPPGADAVVRHEWTDRGAPRVTLSAMPPGRVVAPWECVHRRAADARAGDVVLPVGTILRPHHVGVAAAVGARTVVVSGGPPCVCTLSSGDEVVPPETPSDELRPHQIRNSNLPMLASAVPCFGGALTAARHVADDSRATRAALERALGEADVVVTIGGVSAGERDHFPEAMESLGVRMILRGAAIQPGRPIVVGARADGVVVVGLPGNPVSALVTAHLFLWPVLRRLGGVDRPLPWRDVKLATTVEANARRRLFRPSALDDAGRAAPPRWAGSGDLAHTTRTVGLIELPVQERPCPPGAAVRFLPWAWESAPEAPP